MTTPISPDFINESTASAGGAGDIPCPMTLHIIPQAHIDLVWFWGPEESLGMVLDTFRGHVERLEADQTLTYAQSQTATYALVLQHDPQLFQRVQALVKEGRWELVGGEWTEADPALPGPEARLRQYLLGQRFFQQHFGRLATVGWSPDGFTVHPGVLPQMLKQAGMNYFVHKRPREVSGHCPLLPYHWCSKDGSEVLAYRSNNKGMGLPVLSQGTSVPPGMDGISLIAHAFSDVGIHHLWGPMGVGDVGGVNSYRTPETHPLLTPVYSTPAGFFAAALEGIDLNLLPVVTGAMPAEFMGALTTWARVKSLNRLCENRLLQAEAVMGIARAHGIPVDAHTLDTAWQTLLYYQFHDSLAGCGTDPVREVVEHQLQQVDLLAREALTRYAGQLAARVPGGPGLPVVVFNPLGHTRSDMVTAHVLLPEELRVVAPLGAPLADTHAIDCSAFRADSVELVAVDMQGNSVPVLLQRYAQLQPLHVADIRFRATDVPGFGYKSFFLQLRERSAPVVTHTDALFITDRLAVEFDFAAGGIKSVRNLADSTLDISAGAEPLGALRIVHTGSYPIDYGVELRAWRTGFTGEETLLRPVQHTVEELNGGRVAVTFDYTWGASNFRQQFLLEPGAAAVQVTLSGDWQEVEQYLRMQFAFADGPYDFTVELAEGDESLMQYCCGVRDTARVLLITNTGRYACRMQDGALSVAAIRCASYPAPVSDRGAFDLSYSLSLLPVTSDWMSKACQQGFAANLSLIGNAPTHTSGDFPAQYGLFAQEPHEVLATCLKPAYDHAGLVIRTFNPIDVTVQEQLVVASGALHEEESFLEQGAEKAPAGSWRPWEIKTLVVREAKS